MRDYAWDSQSQQAVTHPMAALSDPGIGSYWLQSFSEILTSSQSSSSEPSRQSLSPLHTRWRFRQRPEQGEVVDASRASRTTPPPSWPVSVQFSSVQSLSHVWLFLTPWTAARQASLFITNSRSLLKLMSIESVMPSNHLILCCPLLLLPSIFPSIRVFSNESALCIRWPKYYSFSFNISPSNEYSGLISFRMDWLDLLAVEGTLKSLLQHHSLKTSVLWHSAFLIVQLSHLYMTTGSVPALKQPFSPQHCPIFLSSSLPPPSSQPCCSHLQALSSDPAPGSSSLFSLHITPPGI